MADVVLQDALTLLGLTPEEVKQGLADKNEVKIPTKKLDLKPDELGITLINAEEHAIPKDDREIKFISDSQRATLIIRRPIRERGHSVISKRYPEIKTTVIRSTIDKDWFSISSDSDRVLQTEEIVDFLLALNQYLRKKRKGISKTELNYEDKETFDDVDNPMDVATKDDIKDMVKHVDLAKLKAEVVEKIVEREPRFIRHIYAVAGIVIIALVTIIKVW